MTLYYLPKNKVEKHPVLTQEDLIPLNDLSNLIAKIEKMTEMLEIPSEEYNDRRTACGALRELLRKYYPDCLLLMYGSSVNGFGVKNCDLDLLFLPFPGYSNLDFVEVSTDKPTIPEPNSILTGETSKDVLSKFDEWSHLKFIRTILRRDKTLVKKVTFIPTKNPSLKINLTDSKVVCDLAASNRLVVIDSELLQFFGKVDPRVKPLVVILRYWARKLGFLRKSFFTTYSFTLLIIFFLQNTSPPILPSVDHLMKIAGFSRKTAGWETAFATDTGLVQKSKNTKTLGELLINFFEYYWNFDFAQNVISPHFGKPVSVTELKKNEKMKDFEIAPISIQDPFILTNNICKTESQKIVLKLAFLIAHKILEDNKFSMLFDLFEYQKVLDLNYSEYMIRRPKVCFINLDHDCMVKLSKLSDNPLFLWHKKATQAVFDILQFGLLIECEVVDTVSWDDETSSVSRSNGVGGKYIAPESNCSSKQSSPNAPYSLELLQSLQCVLYSRTWMGRKSVTDIETGEDDSGDFNGTTLRAEYSISRHLVKTNPLLDSRVPLLWFECDCYRHTTPQIADLVVMLRPLTFSREFYQVSSFLSSYVPKTVKKMIVSD